MKRQNYERPLENSTVRDAPGTNHRSSGIGRISLNPFVAHGGCPRRRGPNDRLGWDVFRSSGTCGNMSRRGTPCVARLVIPDSCSWALWELHELLARPMNGPLLMISPAPACQSHDGPAFRSEGWDPSTASPPPSKHFEYSRARTASFVRERRKVGYDLTDLLIPIPHPVARASLFFNEDARLFAGSARGSGILA